MVLRAHHPPWIRKQLATGFQANLTECVVRDAELHTVCDSARCPNRNECYSKKTATYLILGNRCTRRCAFCSTVQGAPLAPDLDEPIRLVNAVKALGLQHVVITSVTRDDLDDEGSGQFCRVIKALRENIAGITIEILTPDFKKTRAEAVSMILASPPDIFGHNVETVPRLYAKVRPGADYEGSLDLLRRIKITKRNIWIKSALLLGLGESQDEVLDVLRDLRVSGCDILALGQYLKPESTRMDVVTYVHPDVFLDYKTRAYGMGFQWVESAPFVRSSYQSQQAHQALLAKKARKRF